MKLRRSILFVLVTVGCGGCGGTPDASWDVGQSNQAIFGGVVDLGDPAVVALTDDQGYYFCSGTIVDPLHVITAAHCLAEGYPPSYIFVCPDNNNPQSDQCFLEVQSSQYNPAYQGESAHDIGVVTLAQPTSIKPIPVPAQSLGPSAIGTMTRLIGYGDDEYGDTGVKRQVTRPIDDLDASTFSMNGLPNHCYGDSGGPALWPAGDPNEQLVGVTSAGTADSCDRGAGIDCMVGDNLGWLATQGIVPDPSSSGSSSSSSASSGSGASGSTSATTGVGAGVGGGSDVAGAGGSGASGSSADEPKDHSGADASDDGGCSYGAAPVSSGGAWLLLALGVVVSGRRRSTRAAGRR